MTYCVGMMLKRGLVFMSDTRTNAGLDNISSFKKMVTWEQPGERMLTLLSAGNLATTQAVIGLLDERSKEPDNRAPSLLRAASMFQAARMVGDTLRDVITEHNEGGPRAETSFDATLILGGQIAGGPPRLFLIYPEGNFIEASADTPYFQIGEIKYGRPILVRAYDPDLSFAEAIKLLLVSFDSTIKANLSVGAPLDYMCYEVETMTAGPTGRVEASDPQYRSVALAWGDALKGALDGLPDVDLALLSNGKGS